MAVWDDAKVALKQGRRCDSAEPMWEDGLAMTALLRVNPHIYKCVSIAPDCRSASNCIPPYSMIRLGLGAHLYSSSVFLPPCSLPRNSHTFPQDACHGQLPGQTLPSEIK